MRIDLAFGKHGGVGKESFFRVVESVKLRLPIVVADRNCYSSYIELLVDFGLKGKFAFGTDFQKYVIYLIGQIVSRLGDGPTHDGLEAGFGAQELNDFKFLLQHL